MTPPPLPDAGVRFWPITPVVYHRLSSWLIAAAGNIGHGHACSVPALTMLGFDMRHAAGGQAARWWTIGEQVNEQRLVCGDTGTEPGSLDSPGGYGAQITFTLPWGLLAAERTAAGVDASLQPSTFPMGAASDGQRRGTT